MSNMQIGDLENAVEEDTSLQFVTFQVGDEVFGFSMAQVSEIIRLPQTVEVPLTPGALHGLANLRGTILPVLDLRQILHMDRVEHNDATRVVVTDAGSQVGLVVDRVLQVVNATADQIEDSTSVQSNVDSDVLNGVLKTDQHLVQILNVNQLISQEFQRVAAQAASVGDPTGLSDIIAEDDEDEDMDQLVSFSVDSQEYAFDLMDVEGTLRVPEHITQVPQAGSHVLGLIDLRGTLVPLLSLRRMFALRDAEITEAHRILLVNLRKSDGSKESVGLVVDQVREVLRVPRDVQDAMPGLLQADADEITRVCRLDNGKRLVSVVATDALFGHPAVTAALEENPTQHTETTEQEEMIEENAQLVVFLLNGQEYSVSIDDVQEITRVPERMDKVPKTASFIDGMVNLRGTVLPVLDMRTRFNIERMPSNDRQRIIVLSVEGVRTGFVVDSVAEVLRLAKDQIETAPNLSEEQSRVISQVVNLKEDKRMIQVLTVDELLSNKELSTIATEAA
ncbi:MAG: chemotaxis protein CheW [Litorivicinus sp.]